MVQNLFRTTDVATDCNRELATDCSRKSRVLLSTGEQVGASNNCIKVCTPLPRTFSILAGLCHAERQILTLSCNQ
jgi:hypothetical protein